MGVVPPEEKFMLSLLRWFGHVQQKLVNALWFFILSIIILKKKIKYNFIEERKGADTGCELSHFKE